MVMPTCVWFRVAQEVLRGLARKSHRKHALLSLNARSFHLGRTTMVRYITQKEATDIDNELFNLYKFSLEQLMELAGLSCASAIFKCYSVQKYPSVLVLCGPGNNGGDGLVCARHLKHFGYQPQIYYPKPNKNDHFKNLVEQSCATDIYFHQQVPNLDKFDLVVDALFGFSFKPPVRSEYLPIMEMLCNTKAKICSIDMPSGWDVNTGRPPGGFIPDCLISLTAPKIGVNHFGGKYHFLGGRFIPSRMASMYDLRLPEYPNSECCVDITDCENNEKPPN